MSQNEDYLLLIHYFVASKLDLCMTMMAKISTKADHANVVANLSKVFFFQREKVGCCMVLK
jgi:hypothetical protein